MAVLKSPKNNKHKKLWIKSKVQKNLKKHKNFNTKILNNSFLINTKNTWKAPQNKINKYLSKYNLKLLFSSYFY